MDMSDVIASLAKWLRDDDTAAQVANGIHPETPCCDGECIETTAKVLGYLADMVTDSAWTCEEPASIIGPLYRGRALLNDATEPTS